MRCFSTTEGDATSLLRYGVRQATWVQYGEGPIKHVGALDHRLAVHAAFVIRWVHISRLLTSHRSPRGGPIIKTRTATGRM